MPKCIECEWNVRKLYEDPRSPPLDEDECLCYECTTNAFVEYIEELQENIYQVKEDQTNHSEKSNA